MTRIARQSTIKSRLCVGLLLVGLAPLAHTQSVDLTGDSSSTINYLLSPSPGLSASILASDPTSLTGTAGATTSGGTAVSMQLSFLDTASPVQAATSACGSGCFEQAMNGSGTFSVATLSGNTTLVSGTLSNGEIFATPGASQAGMQFTLTTSSGAEFLILSGATTSPVSVCNPGSLFCVPVPATTPPAAGSVFSPLSLSGGWTETVSTTPFGTLPPGSRLVFLNSANLVNQNVSWSAPANPWLLNSTTSLVTTTPPSAGDDVFVVNTTATVGSTTVNFDASADPQLHSLTIDSQGGATGHQITLSQASGVLTSGTETIGGNGLATHLQSGGINSVTGTLALNGNGTYALEGGALNASTIQINAGGTLDISANTQINFGALNITTGGTVNAFGAETLDTPSQSNKTYTVTQTGGSNHSTGSLSLGGFAAGTYLLSAGTVAVDGSLNIGGFAGGDFQQSGGGVTVGTMTLGLLPASSGTYELSGPTATLSAQSESVGSSFGSGTFTQTGGTNTTNNLILAANPGATGAYNMNGGILNAATITVNAGGTFTFNSGGLNFNNLNLSGGTVQASGNEVLAGAFSQTAGTNTVNNELVVGFLGAATYSLQSGTLNANTIVVTNGSTFNFNTASPGNGQINTNNFTLNGGGLVASGLTIGTTADASSPLGFDGIKVFTQNSDWGGPANGSLVINNNGTYLLVNGRLGNPPGPLGNVTVNGGGVFTQTGGDENLGNGATFINSGGVYNLQGGALATTTLNISAGGTFNQTGGINGLDAHYGFTPGSYNVSGTFSGLAGQFEAVAVTVSPGGVFNESGATFDIYQFTLDGMTSGFTSSNAVARATTSGNEYIGAAQLVGLTDVFTTFSFNSYTQNGAFASDNAAVASSIHTVTDSLFVGLDPGSFGFYTLNGGALSVLVSEEVGYQGTGTFTQNGGTNSTRELDVGVGPGSANTGGTYTLTGGQLNAGTMSVGVSGVFTQSGGQLNAGTMSVSASGAFTQTGGQVTVSGDLTNFGTFTQSGGQTTVGGDVKNSGVIIVSGAAASGCAANLALCNFVVDGTLSNSAILVIGDGATVHAGTYSQTGGSMLIGGGTLDPAAVNISGGTVSGTGTIVGNVTVSNATVSVGGANPGVLHIEGNYSQTGGVIEFLVGSNGSGGFLVSDLLFDPGNSVSVSGTNFLFDFTGSADPLAFLASGQFNLDTFFQESDGSAFSSDVALASAFQGDTFEYQIGTGAPVTLDFDATTGNVTAASVPEPSTLALCVPALGMLGALACQRRRRSRALVSAT